MYNTDFLLHVQAPGDKDFREVIQPNLFEGNTPSTSNDLMKNEQKRSASLFQQYSESLQPSKKSKSDFVSRKNLYHVYLQVFHFQQDILIQLVIASNYSFRQNIKSILEESEIGKQILSELTDGKLSRKSRIKMVQVLVAHLINNFGERYVK